MRGIKRPFFCSLFAVLLLSFVPSSVLAQQPGDALQLFSYEVTTATKPDVSDGLIAPSSDPTDWQAAYVRKMTIDTDAGGKGNRPMTVLIGNSSDTLYVAAAVELPNAAQQNRLTLYFDQETDETLDGSSSDPGEYFLTMTVDGDPGDGHWDGSQWQANADTIAAGTAQRRGTGSPAVYNFEWKIPLNKTGDSDTGDSNNSYLNLSPGDEVGVLPVVTDNEDDTWYWDKTNENPTDPGADPGWGDIRTIGDGVADRDVVALAAKGITPTIDGDISGDDDWRHSFERDIILTNLEGNTVDATLQLKEVTSSGSLVFGLTAKGFSPENVDHFSAYFDQGSSGGPLNYILNESGDPVLDDASRVLGDGTYQDLYFDGSDWVQDGTVHGNGGASVNSDGDWEVEFEVPLSSGDGQDLDVSTEDPIGVLFELNDDSRSTSSHWWTATINTKKIVLDPEDPVFNALGWGNLQTGGPFVQAIYPEDNDTLSGEYPLAVYTTDENDADPKTGIEDVRYELQREDPDAGTVTTLLEGSLSKVEDDTLPIWTGTLNTDAVDVSPDTPLRLSYRIYDGEVDTVSVPVDVFINNEGGSADVDDPSVQIASPSPNDTLSGSGVPIDFSASTTDPLTLDTVQVYVDGALKNTYTPSSTSSFSDTYNWNTSPLPDGEHVIQVRAVNSIGVSNFSPTLKVQTANAPSIGITSPTASSLVRDTVQVEFTATPVDPATLSSTEISVDGGTWRAIDSPPPSSGGTGSHQWDTTVLSDGAHSFRVRTTDSNGKTTASEPVQVTVDNTDPTGPLATDAERYRNGDEVSFAYDAGETDLDASISAAELSNLDSEAGSALSLTDPNDDGIYEGSYTIDPQNQRADGVKTIQATASDSVGNSYQAEVSVLLDNTAPVFESLTVEPRPEGSDSLNGEVYKRSVTLKGSYFDQPDSSAVEELTIHVKNENGNPVNDSPLEIPVTEERTYSRSIDLIEGTNQLRVEATDAAGNIQTASFQLTRLAPAETQVITSEGGTIQSSDGTTVEVPEGALNERTEITIERVATSSFPEPTNDNITLLEESTEFGPEGTVFNKPVTVTLTYNDSDLDLDQDGRPDFQEDQLAIFFWDGNTWIKIDPDQRSTSDNSVRFSTNHFSVYALGSTVSADGFNFYWTANPLTPRNGSTAVLETTDDGGTVSLKIYDSTGNLIRTLAEQDQVSGSKTYGWNGMNEFGRFVGSGSYIYVLKYTGPNGETRMIRKPIGVVK